MTRKMLYDDGGVSRWIGVPCLTIGTVVLWLAISDFCQNYLDLNFMFQMRGESPNSLLAIIICLIFGCFMSNVFFLRNRCYFDPEKKNLVMRHNCIFGKFDKIVPLRDAESLFIQQEMTIKGRRTYFNFGISFPHGKTCHITRVFEFEDLPIEPFAAATGLEVNDRRALHGDSETTTSMNEKAPLAHRE